MLINIPKMGLLKGDKRTKNGYSCIFIGITLRQWAILVSILFFIITAVVTTCTALGTLHTKHILELLECDIEVERERSQQENVNGHISISSNEAILHTSEDFVIMSTKMLSIYMWISWFNLVLTALLIYGVCTKSPTYIIPWIVTSGATYILTVTTEFMAYFNLLPEYYYFTYSNVLLITIAASPIFIMMWIVIVVYYVQLNRHTCSRDPSYLPTSVVKSNGDYTHTLNMSTNVEKVNLV